MKSQNQKSKNSIWVKIPKTKIRNAQNPECDEIIQRIMCEIILESKENFHFPGVREYGCNRGSNDGTFKNSGFWSFRNFGK